MHQKLELTGYFPFLYKGYQYKKLCKNSNSLRWVIVLHLDNYK